MRLANPGALLIKKLPERLGEFAEFGMVRPDLSVQLPDGFLDGGDFFVPEMLDMEVEDGGDINIRYALEQLFRLRDMGGSSHFLEQDQALDELVLMAAVVEFDAAGGQATGGEVELFLRLSEEGFHALVQGVGRCSDDGLRLVIPLDFGDPMQGGEQFIPVGFREFLPEPVGELIAEETGKISFIRVALVVKPDEAVDIGAAERSDAVETFVVIPAGERLLVEIQMPVVLAFADAVLEIWGEVSGGAVASTRLENAFNKLPDPGQSGLIGFAVHA